MLDAVIELFSCSPLRAAITQQQCEINRRSIGSCVRCAGLGELVESVDGAELQSPRVVVPQEAHKVTLKRLATPAEDLVGEYTCIDLVDHPESVTFEVVDPDDIHLLRKIEAVAYEHGSTLGDEIMLRLHVLEAHL